MGNGEVTGLSLAVLVILFLTFIVGRQGVNEKIHTNKQGCEYVEKKRCVQVWVTEDLQK
jgi:hypothetical protein